MSKLIPAVCAVFITLAVISRPIDSNAGPAPVPVGEILPNDTVWVEDSIPAGAIAVGTWNWDTSLKVSGTQSHTEPATAGTHQHYFQGTSQPLTILAGDKLFCYVYLSNVSRPREAMLQWYDSTGSWEHRAYWGSNLIPFGTTNTPSRYGVAALPSYGQWVRLEVPASAVGLEGRTIAGMAFTLYDGQAWFDNALKSHWL